MTTKIPIRTYSALNERIHWAKRARRTKQEREVAYLFAANTFRGINFPMTVKLTRVAPRMLDDDNLRGALKGIRDGIADRLGIDDREPCVTWEYGQCKGDPGEYAVIVDAAE